MSDRRDMMGMVQVNDLDRDIESSLMYLLVQPVYLQLMLIGHLGLSQKT